MLRILGYAPSQSDERKFLYSNYKSQILDKPVDFGPFEAQSPQKFNYGQNMLGV